MNYMYIYIYMHVLRYTYDLRIYTRQRVRNPRVEYDAARELKHAANDIAHSFQDCLELSCAGDKSAGVANSRTLVNLVRGALGRLGTNTLKKSDAWGSTLGCQTLETQDAARQIRNAKLGRRRFRLQMPSASAKRAAGVVFVSGI